MRTDNPAVQDALIAAYEYVIARFDPDGFRIDTLRYLKGDLPRQFGNAVREFAESIGKRNFFTFGEVLDNTAENDIARFIGRNTLDVTNQQHVGVDAALDYPLFSALKPVVKGLAAPDDGDRDVRSAQNDRGRHCQLARGRHPVLRHVPGQSRHEGAHPL